MESGKTEYGVLVLSLDHRGCPLDYPPALVDRWVRMAPPAHTADSSAFPHVLSTIYHSVSFR